MAQKLRRNMPQSHTLLISDVNTQVLSRFVRDLQNVAGHAESGSMEVHIAENAREVAERSVSIIIRPSNCLFTGHQLTRFVFPERHNHMSSNTTNSQGCFRRHSHRWNATKPTTPAVVHRLLHY